MGFADTIVGVVSVTLLAGVACGVLYSTHAAPRRLPRACNPHLKCTGRPFPGRHRPQERAACGVGVLSSLLRSTSRVIFTLVGVMVMIFFFFFDGDNS